jgi:FkbM family methyltransferase
MIITKLFKRILRKDRLNMLIAQNELKRLRSFKRYEYTQTTLFDKTFKLVDACTFLSSLDEIFVGQIYKFETENVNPVIIDCGANIGLATLYFKMNFPNAIVTAFEPDPNIFALMKENIETFGFNDVIFKNEALSVQDSIINFRLEGGHSGMIVQSENDNNCIKVKSTRLKTFLQQYNEITFLKIDIEGHERNLISDIADELKRVKFLFLEYHSFINENQNLDEILKCINSAGLRYYIKESCIKSFPFINRQIFLGMDLLLNIFCYKK